MGPSDKEDADPPEKTVCVREASSLPKVKETHRWRGK